MRLCLLAALAVVGCSEAGTDRDVVREIADPGRLDVSDPEIQPVRAWLKENLDQPKWTEVKWYKPLRMGEQNGEVWKICRIKVRTPSPSGGEVLRDLVFYSHGGKVEAAPAGEKVYFKD